LLPPKREEERPADAERGKRKRKKPPDHRLRNPPLCPLGRKKEEKEEKSRLHQICTCDRNERGSFSTPASLIVLPRREGKGAP